NIDDLHQKAGSKNIIEYHGKSQKLICPHCNKQFRPDEVDLNNLPPHCPDDAYVLKPDFVFFGEAIPGKASLLSSEESQHAEVFLLVGTTGEVMPASMVPRFAKDSGAIIIEINPEESLYTTEITDIFLRGKAGKILPELVRKLLAG
ncbi:MAG: NAD-dependent deacetylase, partial [Bacteroidales bacterium]|nr:NAD-dependent deacetylase [Bacteroidales bacterium]